MFMVKHFVFIGLVISTDGFFKGYVASGQVVTPTDSGSLKSHMTVIKGSSVWLHWQQSAMENATYTGSTAMHYKEQIIGFKSILQSSLEAVAKRIGHNGALILQSSIPAIFRGRVEVISSNDTLVISRLQYNDSLYQLASNIILESNPSGTPFIIDMKPIITLNVTGVPDFKTHPPEMIDVNENSSLVLRIEMDGNPMPSALFKWMHLPTSSAETVPSVQLYPFVYYSKFSLGSVDASYCGRVLQTKIENSIGSPSTKNTNVTVLLKLAGPLDMKATKTVDQCVGVKWNKLESGACFVKYDVKFKNESGGYVRNETGYNIGEMKICNLTIYDNITEVQLTVSFRNASKTVTATVSQEAARSEPPNNTPDSKSNLDLIVGDSIRWMVVLTIVIGFASYFARKFKRDRENNVSSGDNLFEENQESDCDLENNKDTEVRVESITNADRSQMAPTNQYNTSVLSHYV